MREILFRAKTEPNCKDVMNGKIIKNPKWIYGYVDLGYMHDCKAPLISDKNGNKTYKCQYETIGQFTGLTDKNGKKIFEGDIVTACDEITFSPFEFGITGKVVYDECAFFIEPKDVMETQYLFNECAVYEVIGNIHDNPELLETPKEAMYE